MTSEVTKCDSNAEKSSVAVVNDSLETILLGRRTHTCSIASGPSELRGKGGHLPHPILAYQLNPGLKTQSCKRRPLCSTFTFENVHSSKTSFIPKKFKKKLNLLFNFLVRTGR